MMSLWIALNPVKTSPVFYVKIRCPKPGCKSKFADVAKGKSSSFVKSGSGVRIPPTAPGIIGLDGMLAHPI